MDPLDPGFQHHPQVFDRDEIAAVTSILTAIPSNSAGRRWAGTELSELLHAPAMQAVPQKLVTLLTGMAIIRIVAFRKDADANWFVPPHQDRSIPVPSAALLPGFSNLTRKDGGWQAEAPAELLRRMRNCRIFVDPATIDDGPLEVIPGSQRRGRIEQAEIADVTARAAWQPIIGAAGDLVILAPLLLHRSRRAGGPSGRRVLQIECVPVEIAQALGLEAFPL